MKRTCIVVNPWIYDFAAMNLWSRPLGLLKVAEYMSQFGFQVSLIDCMDVFAQRRYGTGNYPREIVEKPNILKGFPRYFKRYGIRPGDFTERLKSLIPYDFVCITYKSSSKFIYLQHRRQASEHSCQQNARSWQQRNHLERHRLPRQSRLLRRLLLPPESGEENAHQEDGNAQVKIGRH